MRAFLLSFFLFPLAAFSQVGIGTSSPSASAKLQVDATTQGFLPPRVALVSTSNASSPISSPATGLLVYNTATAGTSPSNVTPGFYYYDGSKWQRIINQQPDATVSFSSADPNTGSPTFDPPANAASKDYIYVSSVDNSQWTYNGTAYVTYNPPASTAWMLSGNTTDAGSNKSGSVYRTGSVAIGGTTSSPVTTVNSSAQLEVISTSKGFLPPRVALVSTSNASSPISSPATGLLVYNTATAGSGATAVTPGFYYYDGSRWQRVSAQQPDATVTFDKITPTTTGVVFTPNISANADYVYVSSLDNSKWTYNGSTSTYSKTFQKSIVTGYFSGSSGTGLRVLTCTETQDRNSDFASNTFTAPRPGLYLVTANLTTSSKGWTVGEELNIGAFQAGTSTPYFLGEFFAQASISTLGVASSSCVISLTAGQQINFQSYNVGGFSLYGQNYNQFSITEL
jgi:hypothetical protein